MAVTIQSKSRIPMALQSIFLASNRGKEVDVAPPSQMACKTFTKPSMHLPTMVSSNKKRSNFMRRIVFGRKENCHSPTPSDEPTTMEMSVELSPGGSSHVTRKSKKPAPAPTLSPRQYLDGVLHSRGYGSSHYKTLATAYYNKPSALQQASYDRYLCDLVKSNDLAAFRSILNCGISPNPCNQFGESILHMVCRRGNLEFLQVMLDAGASVQVSDDFGRTPLHDACWCAQPSFDVVELLLKADPTLMQLQDSRGSLPLEYIHRDHWSEWLQWLAKKKDVYWPSKKMVIGQQQQQLVAAEQHSALATKAALSAPLQDPIGALSLELARMVVSGKMSPAEARYLQLENKQDATTEDEDDDYSDSDDEDDEDDSDYDDEDEEDDDFGFDQAEMSQLIHMISAKQ